MDYQQVAEQLEKDKFAILDRWEERAKKEISALHEQDDLTIRDHLIYYFDDLIGALKRLESSGEPRKSGSVPDNTHSGEEHARLRAATKGYDIAQLIHEYALLRQVITDYLRERSSLSIDLLETLNRNNEAALLIGATEFTKSIARTQEKIASALVHDIRNPLSAVQMSLQLINTSEGDPKNQEQLIQRGLSDLSRIDRMTEEILDTMRLQAGQVLELNFRHMELKEGLRPALETIQVTYPERVKLHLTPEPIYGIFGLEGIVRTLENLITNAMKYGDPQKEILVSLTTEGDEVVIEVHNWGEPIPDEKREAIFMSFNRSGSVKRYSTKGWGLGLAYVQATAEAHQGKIVVSSTREEGTIFRLRFPKDHPDRKNLASA